MFSQIDPPHLGVEPAQPQQRHRVSEYQSNSLIINFLIPSQSQTGIAQAMPSPARDPHPRIRDNPKLDKTNHPKTKVFDKTPCPTSMFEGRDQY